MYSLPKLTENIPESIKDEFIGYNKAKQKQIQQKIYQDLLYEIKTSCELKKDIILKKGWKKDEFTSVEQIIEYSWLIKILYEDGDDLGLLTQIIDVLTDTLYEKDFHLIPFEINQIVKKIMEGKIDLRKFPLFPGCEAFVLYPLIESATRLFPKIYGFGEVDEKNSEELNNLIKSLDSNNLQDLSTGLVILSKLAKSEGNLKKMMDLNWEQKINKVFNQINKMSGNIFLQAQLMACDQIFPNIFDCLNVSLVDATIPKFLMSNLIENLYEFLFNSVFKLKIRKRTKCILLCLNLLLKILKSEHFLKVSDLELLSSLEENIQKKEDFNLGLMFSLVDKQPNRYCALCNMKFEPYQYEFDDDDENIFWEKACNCPNICDFCDKVKLNEEVEDYHENHNDQESKNVKLNDFIKHAIENKGTCQCDIKDPFGLFKLIGEITSLSALKLKEGQIKNSKEMVLQIKKIGNDFFVKKEYEKAKEKYLEALEKNLNGDTEILETCLNNLGYIYLTLKEYDLAFKYFEATLHVNPENFKAIYRKALCYKEKKLLFEAQEELFKLKKINIKGTEKEVDIELMLIKEIVDEHFKKAINFFAQKEYELSSIEFKKISKFEFVNEDQKFLNYMAEIYYYYFDFSKALELVEKALKNEPNKFNLCLLQAKCLINLGFIKEAQDVLVEMKEKFVENENNGREIEEELKFLKVLKK